MRGADPLIVLVPGVGMFTFGKDKQTARVAGEFYVNAINVMRGAEALSTYAPIDEAEKFRIEYWALEEAKLAADAEAQAARHPDRARHRRRLRHRQGDRHAARRRGRVRRHRRPRRWRRRRPPPPRSAAPTSRSASRRRHRRGRGRRPRSTRPCSPSAASTSSSTTPACRSRSRCSRPPSADWDLQHDVMAKGSFLVSAGRRGGDDRAGPGRRHRLHLLARTRSSPARTTSPTRRPRPTRPTRCGCSPPSSASTASGSTASTPTASCAARASSPAAGARSAPRSTACEEEDLGAFYAQRTLLKREVLPEHVANAVVRAASAGPHPHHRAARPGRRRASPRRSCGEPAVRHASPRSTSGASSGRVMLRPGRAGRSCDLERGRPVPATSRCGPPDGLHWDVPALYRRTCSAGLRARRPRADEPLARRRHRLLGRRLRAARAAAGCSASRSTTATSAPPPGVERGARAGRPAEGCTRRNGLQFLPFNTLYQLAADPRPRSRRDRLLLVPDLLGYWLTGAGASPSAPTPRPPGCSTSRTGEWDADAASRRSACRAGSARPAGRPGRRRRAAAARRRPRSSARPALDGHHGRLARHRLGRRRRADADAGRGVHLLRHLGAGRRRARRAGAHRGRPRGQLHQRGRRRRHASGSSAT